MRFKLLSIFSVLVFAFQWNVEAQDSANLSAQYQNMIENSETFERYKVIPITKVNEFGEALNDTISTLSSKVSSAKEAQKEAEAQRDTAKAEMSELQSQLEKAQSAVDKMPLFGIPMTKTTYNIVMWSIVIVLVAGLVIIYVMFLNSFRLTRQAKKDKELVDQEIEDLRKRSHDKQVKIKRELQTALNKLDEYKR